MALLFILKKSTSPIIPRFLYHSIGTVSTGNNHLQQKSSHIASFIAIMKYLLHET